MRDGVNTARKAADDDDCSHREIAAEALRHLRAIQTRLARADDAEAWRVQNLNNCCARKA